MKRQTISPTRCAWHSTGMASATLVLLALFRCWAVTVHAQSLRGRNMTNVVVSLPPEAPPGAPLPNVPPRAPANVPQGGVPSPVVNGDVGTYLPTQPASAEVLPLDLATAWSLAARQNPTIGLARQVVQENLAYLLQARALAIPSLNAGMNNHLHNGNLQQSSGNILNVPDERALYLGGGAQTVAGGTVGIPAVQIYARLADAFYAPLAARQDVNASRFDARATSNSILLDVTTHYLELVGAEASFAAYRRSEFDMAEVLRPTVAFARAGEGLSADANRVRSAALLLRGKVQKAEAHIAIASAQLARLLQIDPSVALRSPAGPLAIVTVVDPNVNLEALVATASRYRPEMGARTSEVAAANVRYKQERMRPLLPTLAMGFSSGMFGGGSQLVIPTNGSYSGRSDFDVMALWTLQNAGMGNVASWRQRRAEMNEAIADRMRMLNLVRDQVASARADAAARLQEVNIAQRRLQTAEYGFGHEMLRERANEGLPIEALNMVDLLVDARQALIRAVVAYNQAEFRLFVAMGSPPPRALPVVPPQQVLGTANPLPAAANAPVNPAPAGPGV